MGNIEVRMLANERRGVHTRGEKMPWYFLIPPIVEWGAM
jgi:hypothetical protein